MHRGILGSRDFSDRAIGLQASAFRLLGPVHQNFRCLLSRSHTSGVRSRCVFAEAVSSLLSCEMLLASFSFKLQTSVHRIGHRAQVGATTAGE